MFGQLGRARVLPLDVVVVRLRFSQGQTRVARIQLCQQLPFAHGIAFFHQHLDHFTARACQHIE